MCMIITCLRRQGSTYILWVELFLYIGTVLLHKNFVHANFVTKPQQYDVHMYICIHVYVHTLSTKMYNPRERIWHKENTQADTFVPICVHIVRIWLVSLRTTCRLGFCLVYTFNGLHILFRHMARAAHLTFGKMSGWKPSFQPCSCRCAKENCEALLHFQSDIFSCKLNFKNVSSSVEIQCGVILHVYYCLDILLPNGGGVHPL